MMSVSSADAMSNFLLRGLKQFGRGLFRRIVGVGADISMLASALGSRFGRPVIDKTGIAGWFDVDLEFTPETLDSGVGVSASLVTALQEQLGLKVQPERAMREVR